MPELPEVETIRRDLAERLNGKTIRSVRVSDPTVLTGHKLRGKWRREVAPALFCERLRGRTIVQFERRGKYILMAFSEASALVLHLRMTGQLLLAPPSFQERALFEFTDGSRLWFADRRRFGEMFYSEDWRMEPGLRDLGPEPLRGNLDAARLKAILTGRLTPIHSALLNQKLVAGLGNIYAVEALHRARIHPARKAGTLTMQQAERLAQEMQLVLEESIRNRGHSMHTYVDAMGKKGRSQMFTVAYGKEGKPCGSCGSALRRKVLTGRGVVFCPRCQK